MYGFIQDAREMIAQDDRRQDAIALLIVCKGFAQGRYGTGQETILHSTGDRMHRRYRTQGRQGIAKDISIAKEFRSVDK